jgi:hypothetical protein
MARLHFIRVDAPLCTSKLLELTKETEAGFKAKGCPDDKVFLLSLASWLGSVEIDND